MYLMYQYEKFKSKQKLKKKFGTNLDYLKKKKKKNGEE